MGLNRIYFVFLLFKLSLFTEHQFWILCNSLFISLNNSLMLVPDFTTVVSSANKIGVEHFTELGKSLIYSKNKQFFCLIHFTMLMPSKTPGLISFCKKKIGCYLIDVSLVSLFSLEALYAPKITVKVCLYSVSVQCRTFRDASKHKNVEHWVK